MANKAQSCLQLLRRVQRVQTQRGVDVDDELNAEVASVTPSIFGFNSPQLLQVQSSDRSPVRIRRAANTDDALKAESINSIDLQLRQS